jgi:hypothetical protein
MSRFEKIAEFLADRYVAKQGQEKATDIADITDIPVKQAAVTDTVRNAIGEDPMHTTWNLPMTFMGGSLPLWYNLNRIGDNWWRDPADILKKTPFARINDPELIKQLTNPYEKFLFDLFKKYENTTGGPQRVGKLLSNFTGTQNVGTSAYRKSLRKALTPFLKKTPEMAERFKALAMRPDKSYFEGSRQLAETLEKLMNVRSTFPVSGREGFRNLIESLRNSKTVDEVKGVVSKLHDYAEKTVIGKNGRPAGYNGFLLDTPDRNNVHSLVESFAQKKPKMKFMASGFDELGSGLGKFTNIPKQGITATNAFKHPFRTAGSSAFGAVTSGVILPQIMDVIMGSRARPSPANNQKKP